MKITSHAAALAAFKTERHRVIGVEVDTGTRLRLVENSYSKLIQVWVKSHLAAVLAPNDTVVFTFSEAEITSFGPSAYRMARNLFGLEFRRKGKGLYEIGPGQGSDPEYYPGITFSLGSLACLNPKADRAERIDPERSRDWKRKFSDVRRAALLMVRLGSVNEKLGVINALGTQAYAPEWTQEPQLADTVYAFVAGTRPIGDLPMFLAWRFWLASRSTSLHSSMGSSTADEAALTRFTEKLLDSVREKCRTMHGVYKETER